MEKTVLWQIFARLTKLERKHLGFWLRSPFFCRREPPLALFLYMEKCVESGNTPLQAEAYAQIAGPGIPFKVQILRSVMSELLAQIEHFLAYRETFETAADLERPLVTAYRKRGLEKHFRQSAQALRARWAQQPYRHTEYFDAQAEIEYEWYQHLSAGIRTEALNLQALFDQTDTAFITRKLRQVCFALSHQTVYKAEYQYGMLDAVLDYVSQSEQLRQIPAVSLYFYCYRFLTDPEGEHFFLRFKSQLFAALGQFPVDEQRNLHLFALNFCIRKINQSNARYYREALDLYQSALKAGLLIENGQLSHFAYNNIIAIALKVGELDWSEQFIHEFMPVIEKKHRDAAFHLNLARVAYSRRNLRDALLHLQQADYKDRINNLIAKTLQFKIYYETGEYDALDAHLQSMQTYIQRQRLIGYHKTNYLNLVRYGRRLMQLDPNNRQARAALRQKIESETVLTEKEWFISVLVF